MEKGIRDIYREKKYRGVRVCVIYIYIYIYIKYIIYILNTLHLLQNTRNSFIYIYIYIYIYI